MLQLSLIRFLVFSVFGCLLLNDVNGQDPSLPRPMLPPIPGLISRDPSGQQQCFPAYVCQGIKLNEIPYIFDHVTANFVNPRSNNLFDTRKTQSCLANKRVLVLGDSVL
jgi:hypothetical protein